MIKVRKKAKFLEELISSRDIKQERRELIFNTIQELNENNGYIDSVGSLVEKLRVDTNEIVRRHEVIEVLKKDLGMSFRKIRPLSVHANSDKNLVLR